MTTWDAQQPPVLPAAGFAQKLIGAMRVAALLVVTLIAVGFFLTGRAMRAVFGKSITFHFWVARLWSQICLALTGLRLKISGQPIRAGALVANHSSWIDILALRAVRLIYFVSKDDVAQWPGVGFIARITGTVFIKRKRTEAKRQEAVLRERIAHNQLMCFFPEGTSSDGMRVLPFKSSLFSVFYAEGLPVDFSVQPVSLKYTPSERTELPENFYGWWGSMSFESHIWDVVTRSNGGLVEIMFHSEGSPGSHKDRKALADHCQNVVAAGFTKLSEATKPSRIDIAV